MSAQLPELPFDKEKALWDKDKQLREQKTLLLKRLEILTETIIDAQKQNEEPKQEWLDEKKELKEQIKEVECDIKKVEQDIDDCRGFNQLRVTQELQKESERLELAGLEAFRASHRTAFDSIRAAFNECTVVSDDRAQGTVSAGPPFKSTKSFFQDQLAMMKKTVKLPLFKEDVPHDMEPSAFIIIDKDVRGLTKNWMANPLFRMSAHLAFFLSGGRKGEVAATLRDAVPRKGDERQDHEAYCEMFAFLQDTKYSDSCVSTCNQKAGNDASGESSSYFMPDRRPDLCLSMVHTVNGVIPLLPLEIKASEGRKKKKEVDTLKEARKELQEKVVGPTWIPLLYHGVVRVYGAVATMKRFKGFCFSNGSKGVSSTEVCDISLGDGAEFSHFRLRVAFAALTLATINAVAFAKGREKEDAYKIHGWVAKAEQEFTYEGNRKKPKAHTHFFLADSHALHKVAVRLPGRQRNSAPGNVAPWVEKAAPEGDADTPYAKIDRAAWCNHVIKELAADDARASVMKLQFTSGVSGCKVRCLAPVGQHAGLALSCASDLAVMTKHVFCGLAFLHASRFVHRDVRLENIISVADSNAPGVAKYVLIDLDGCSALDEGKAFATMPPESRTLDARIVSKGYYPLPENQLLDLIRRSTMQWTCLCDINQFFWFILRSPVIQKQVFDAKGAGAFTTQVDLMQRELNTDYPTCDARNIYLSGHYVMHLVGPTGGGEFTSSCSCHVSQCATKSVSTSVVNFLEVVPSFAAHGAA